MLDNFGLSLPPCCGGLLPSHWSGLLLGSLLCGPLSPPKKYLGSEWGKLSISFPRKLRIYRLIFSCPYLKNFLIFSWVLHKFLINILNCLLLGQPINFLSRYLWHNRIVFCLCLSLKRFFPVCCHSPLWKL